MGDLGRTAKILDAFGLRGNVFILAVTSAWATFGGYLWLYFFPLYLKSGLSFSNATIGAIYGVGGFCFAVAFFPGGILGDTLGRKPLIVMGSLLITVPSAVLAASDTVGSVYFSYVILQIGLSIFQANYQSMISESVKKESRGIALGTFLSLSSTLASLAPIIGGIILDNGYNYGRFFPLFVTASTILLTATLVRLAFLKESLKTAPKIPKATLFQIKRAFALYKNTNLLRLLLGYCFHDFALSMVFPFFSILMVQTLKATSFQLGIVLFIPAATLVIFQIPFGKLSDVLGRKLIVLGSFIGELVFIFAFSFSGYLLSNRLLLAIVLWSFAATFGQMDLPAKTAWLADISNPQERSSLIGSFSSFTTLFASAAPVFGSVLFSMNAFLPFFATSIPLLVGLLLVVSVHKIQGTLAA
jgi:MFS family permease